MSTATLEIVVPIPDSDAVLKLRQSLRTNRAAATVRVIPAPRAMEGCCHQNVREKVNRVGGRMQLGWAVWQHSNLFIEGELHAVYDPGDGREWIDCTPNSFPDGSRCPEILFIPNDNESYDFRSTDIADNVRVPLVDDPRVLEALRLASDKNRLINRVPKTWRSGRLLYHYPPLLLAQITQLEWRITSLLSEALRSPMSRAEVQERG